MGSHRIIGLLFVAVATMASLGCQSRSATDSASESGETGETGDGVCYPYSGCEECWTPGLQGHALDIVVIVDGSIGAAGAQSRLAAGLEQLLTVLDAAEQGIDYRIAITTTDMGPPACDPLVTTPEYGQFIGTSCRERLADFVDADGQDFSSSCTDVCSLDLIERLPTSIGQAPDPAVRPWFEHDGQQTNLPDGVDPLEALRCMAMVGVAGCRYESPLAVIEAVSLGSSNPMHPNYGFFRPFSRRAFVVVSDASECSWSEVGLDIFDPAGTRAFWSDPQADAPTPAVCWNAGTECSSTADGLSCKTGKYNIDGQPTGFPDAMVLRPAGDFVDLLRSNWDSWSYDVVLFTGLTPEGEVLFEVAQDPEFELEHGIGPACDNGAGTVALPPVRMWDFFRAFQDLNDLQQYYANHSESICAPDFGPTLAALGQRSLEGVDRSNCYHSVCDTDPSTELLDVDCDFEAYSGFTNESFDVPECARADDGSYLVDPDTGHAAMPDAQTQLCYLVRADAEQLTADPLDDLWPTCIEEDYPLAFEIVSRDGRLADEYIEFRCSQDEP